MVNNNVIPFGPGGAEDISEIDKSQLPDYQREMLETIEAMDEYAHTRGTLGGFDTGYPALNDAMEGLNTGLILIAGQSNVGKSAFCMQLGWQVSQKNKVPTKDNPNKAYVLYFSLDDNANDLLPRCISIDQKIPINVVKYPAKYKHKENLIRKRASGIQRLKDSIDCFKMVDATKGDSIEYIEQQIRATTLQLKQTEERSKLVVFIDNFHDISVRDQSFSGDNAKYDFLAGELSRICTIYDIPIVCTAEFRKLNGTRRPTVDDIRESTKIGYEAKAVLLCYNEVGLRGESANVFWEQAGVGKCPILEVRVGKNKFSSFKGRIFYEFEPAKSILNEAPEDRATRYSQMITS